MLLNTLLPPFVAVSLSPVPVAPVPPAPIVTVYATPVETAKEALVLYLAKQLRKVIVHVL
jgi:hypothetical protein